jgi:hypothetical protein
MFHDWLSLHSVSCIKCATSSFPLRPVAAVIFPVDSKHYHPHHVIIGTSSDVRMPAGRSCTIRSLLWSSFDTRLCHTFTETSLCSRRSGRVPMIRPSLRGRVPLVHHASSRAGNIISYIVALWLITARASQLLRFLFQGLCCGAPVGMAMTGSMAMVFYHKHICGRAHQSSEELERLFCHALFW